MSADPGPETTSRAGYGDHDRARIAPESPKSARRGAFERDRARVLHSSALRRLGGKTQVVGAGTDDFARTRLTHSLEVAQVGRGLAAALGCDPDVVETACLAHDLGHPPFGHNGEVALAAVCAGIGGFEGNAQTLRLLTRLEPKVHAGGASVGLNLTRAGLDAATKYPWAAGQGPGGSAKFGVYADDLPVFTWLRQGAPADRPCVEAQVMDLADDVAYSVHDVEDAVVAGALELGVLADAGQRRRVAARARDWYLPDVEEAEVHEALDRLTALEGWVTGHGPGDLDRRRLAALKDLTSTLIGRFLEGARTATRRLHPDGALTRYGAGVVVPRDVQVEIAALKAVASVFVMTVEDRQVAYTDQRDLLTGLVAVLVARDGRDLEPVLRADWAAAPDDAARLRVVVDQVASLTDTSAALWARRLEI